MAIAKLQNILKSPSKKVAVLDLIICIFFGLTFYSMPTFSFLSKLNLLTWLFTIVSLLLLVFRLVFINKKISIDLFVLSLSAFSITIFISTLLNGFVNFSFTAILLVISTIIIYVFAKENKQLIYPIINFIYFSTILFLLTFMLSNFSLLIHFDFERLGGEFGNINDVAIFLGLGIALSTFYSFFSKKNISKILNLFCLILFVYCGLSTGTKILLFIFIICFFFVVVNYFGKKRWYFSLIIFSFTITIAFIVISLPAFSHFKERLLSFLSTIFGLDTSSHTYIDYSSIDRLNMFLNGFQMMLRKPLFGYGYHGFHNFSSFGGAWSHNNFTEIFACYGLIGAFFFFFPFIYSFWKSITLIKGDKLDILCPLILLFFLVSMFSFAFDVQKLFAFLIGFIYAYTSEPKIICDFNTDKIFKFLKKEETLI